MIGIGREMHKTPHMAHAVKLIIVIIFYNVFAFNDAKLLGAKTEFHHFVFHVQLMSISNIDIFIPISSDFGKTWRKRE